MGDFDALGSLDDYIDKEDLEEEIDDGDMVNDSERNRLFHEGIEKSFKQLGEKNGKEVHALDIGCETDLLSMIPFPKLDEEFTGKVSFADRCKLMEPIEEKYIYKRVIRPSSEAEHRAVKINHAVLFHLNGFLEEQYEVPFDSSYIRKRPMLSRLDRVLRGCAVALLTMKVGEMAEIAIHYDFAFGKHGCQPRIPERANLIIILEVLDVFERGTIEYFHSLSIYEQEEQVKPEEVIEYARKDLQLGNEMFRKGDHLKAITHFRRAINLIERVASNTSLEDDCNQLLLVLYKNAAVCAIQLENGPSTVNLSRRALRLDNDSAKANFLLGQGYILLKKLERAKLYLIKAQSKRPFDKDISAALDKLDELIAESQNEPDQMLAKAAKALVLYEEPADEHERVFEQYSSANVAPEESHRVSILNMLEVMEKSEPMWDIAEAEDE